MENQKNNKGEIALLIVIIVILSALCILFATGTISLKPNDVDNNELNQDTNENNKTARALYKKLGYKEISIVPCVFNGIEGVGLVLLEKKL